MLSRLSRSRDIAVNKSFCNRGVILYLEIQLHLYLVFFIMPQSLARILLHLIFSTKNREPNFADPVYRREVHAYLAATASHLACPAICVGGAADHVHLVVPSASQQSSPNSRSVPTRQCGKSSRSFHGKTVTRHSPWPNPRSRRLSNTSPIKRLITKRSRSKRNIACF
jgi:REP element-mobilizing transposase RayT